MKHCKTCRRNLEDSAYETSIYRNYKTCTECRTNKRFQCPNCDYKSSKKDHLQKHINAVHLKIKEFACIQCDYKCSENVHLQKHINSVHLKLKIFQCPTCDYKCVDNSHLQKHINSVHLKEKNFQCPTCESKFSQNVHLQKHIEIVHLKEKNFQCPTCEYKCSHASHLQTHIKICTGELNCSAGEFKILKLLEKLNYEKDVDFLHNSSYWNVRDKKLLRWDFVVNHTTDKPLVLEFDGRQHFEPVNFGGSDGTENFIATQRRDKIKNDYCLENNIPILRISYLDIDNIENLISGFLVA
jgi:hypothetical protein